MCSEGDVRRRGVMGVPVVIKILQQLVHLLPLKPHGLKIMVCVIIIKALATGRINVLF